MHLNRLAIAVIVFALSARASVYQYVGNPFSWQQDGWPGIQFTQITATVITSDPIAPNGHINRNDIVGPQLVSYSISDGTQTMTGGRWTGIVNLYADSSGNISNWTIAVGRYPMAIGSDDYALNSWGPGTPCPGGAWSYYAAPLPDGGCPADFSIRALFTGPDGTYPVWSSADNFDSPGSWHETPEPSGKVMLLIGAGMLLVSRWLRVRIRTR